LNHLSGEDIENTLSCTKACAEEELQWLGIKAAPLPNCFTISFGASKKKLGLAKLFSAPAISRTNYLSIDLKRYVGYDVGRCHIY
jgi:hypothetical protein